MSNPNPYTLIVPDVHENLTQLEKPAFKLLESQAEHVVYLGDYFDSWVKHEAPTRHLARVAEYVATRVIYPRYTMLLGNHDLHYMSKHPWLRCSGYHSEKRAPINLRMAEVWNDMPLHTWVGPYLVSHAGFHPQTLPYWNEDTGLAHLKAKLELIEEDALDSLKRGIVHPWLLAGALDGGMGVGGPVWLRWSLLEPLEGIPQIVGHTYQAGEPRLKGDNICLDNGLHTVLQVYHKDWSVLPVNLP